MIRRFITLAFLKIMRIFLFLISLITKTMNLLKFRIQKWSKYLMERKRLNKCNIESWCFFFVIPSYDLYLLSFK